MTSLTLETARVHTPVGMLEIEADRAGIRSVRFLDRASKELAPSSQILRDAVRILRDYVQGKRPAFETVPFALEGTPFQKAVWKALGQIPHGKTVTYGEIAKRVGHPKAVRAVGTAVGANPLCVLIPCHRVVPAGAKEGKWGNYAAGPQRKKWLLEHEKATLD